MNESSLDSYIQFVEDSVRLLKDSSDLIREDTILPYRINACIARYTEIALMLNAEYQRVKWEHRTLERNFAKWWDRKFLLARDNLKADLPKSKYASKSEIESQARADNEDEYAEWQEKIEASDTKVQFLLRQIDIWKKQDQLLITLSNNMRTEMRALSIEDRIDKPVEKTTRRKLADENSEN